MTFHEVAAVGGPEGVEGNAVERAVGDDDQSPDAGQGGRCRVEQGGAEGATQR